MLPRIILFLPHYLVDSNPARSQNRFDSLMVPPPPRADRDTHPENSIHPKSICKRAFFLVQHHEIKGSFLTNTFLEENYII